MERGYNKYSGHVASVITAREAKSAPVGFCVSEQTLLVLTGDLRDCTIICRAGTAWITREGDLQDYRIRRSERFQPPRKGRIVVQGCPEAYLLVTGASEQERLCAIGRFFRRFRFLFDRIRSH